MARSNVEWRNTFRPPKILMVDARLSLFILIAVIHLSKLTFALFLLVASTLYFVEKRKNLSVESSLRWIRAVLCNVLTGKHRMSNLDPKVPLAIDYNLRKDT